jgi:hypothetical protein
MAVVDSFVYMKYLVTIDTEEAWDWSGPYPTSEFSVEHITRLPQFQDLCDRYGVRATYFTNHAVMSDSAASRTMVELSAQSNVEIGMHIHPWNTPPIKFDTPVLSRDTYLHNERAELVRQKLEEVYGSLVSAGIEPKSFRGGRYSSGGAIHQFLFEKQFIAECSVVPYTSWAEDGAPDFRRRDIYPKRLNSDQFGAQAIWEIPLSLGFTRQPFALWTQAFRIIENTPLSRLRLIGIAERLGLLRKVWLNFEINDPYDWTPFLILLQRMRVPCVTFTVHSSSLFAGPGPYTRTIDDEKRIFSQMEKVFNIISNLNGFEPATATEAAIYLERKHACIRN